CSGDAASSADGAGGPTGRRMRTTGWMRVSTPSTLPQRSQAPVRPSVIWHSTGQALHSTLLAAMLALRGFDFSSTVGPGVDGMVSSRLSELWSTLVCSVIAGDSLLGIEPRHIQAR